MTIRYGIYLGVFLVAYGLFFRLLNLPFDSPFGWLFYMSLPVGAGIALYKRRQQGSLSYKAGFLLATSVAVIGAIIYSIYVFGFNAFVDDSLILAVRESSLAEISARGLDAESEANMRQLIELSTTPLGFAITIAMQMSVAGLAAAMIAPVFFRRK